MILNSYWLSYWLISILAFVVLIQIIKFLGKKRDFFEPINLSSLYFFILFVVRPIYDLNGFSWFVSIHDLQNGMLVYFNLALIIILIGYLIFLMVYYSKVPDAIAYSLPNFNLNLSTMKLKIFYPIYIIGIIMLFLLKLKMVGGLSYYLTHKQAVLTAGGLGYIDNMIFFGHFIFMLYLIKYYKKEFPKILIILNFFILFIIDVLSGSKGKVIMLFIFIFIIRHYYYKRFSYKYILYLFLLVLIVFPIFNVWRNNSNFTFNDIINIFENSDSHFWILILFSRFHAFDAFTYIIAYTPQIMNYQWGMTFLVWLISWIPRSLWEGKPVISFGKIFGETYFAKWYAGTGSAASPSIFGIGYVNLNIAGILILLIIAAILIKSFYIYFIKRNKGELGIAIYAYFFVYILNFWERDLTFIISVFYNLILIFIVFLFLKKRNIKKSIVRN